MNRYGYAFVALAVLAATSARADFMDDMNGLKGKKLAEAIAKAEGFPLGSHENPVRVTMPSGEKAYLGKLRCSTGETPAFQRRGSGGSGVFGSIVDIYEVTCSGAQPSNVTVIMDMYHGNPDETRPVPGFTMIQ